MANHPSTRPIQRIRRISGIVAITAALAVSACTDDDTQHSPSGHAVAVPSSDMAFSEYATSTRKHLRDTLAATRFDRESAPFGDFELDQVVDMRAPFALAPDRMTCEQKGKTLAHGDKVGFLMVHGLTDSPFWLRDVRDTLRDRFPCARFHGVLLPGHGTVPGDLTEVTFADWLDTVSYGVAAFDDDIDHVIPVGYSMGAALIGRNSATTGHDPRIRAMIMLSPGLAAKSDLAWLSPYMRHVRKWVGRGTNNDPGKYGSMAMNAAAEFHLLTEPYRDGSIGLIDTPAFLVISSDDQTVDPLVAIDFFCNNIVASPKKMIWYQGEIHAPEGHPQCDDIDIIASANDEMRTINHAHTAITNHPENAVYGINGVIHDCSHYDDPEHLARCRAGDGTMYGERNLVDSATAGTLRRGTFNPDFVPMMDKIVGFIDIALAESRQPSD